MESFNQEQKKREIVHTKRDEQITTDEFIEYLTSDPFYNSCDQLFFPESGSAVEHIPNQKRNLGSSFVHYQIPYKQRGSGIIPSSLTISSGSLSIIDDGNGNLIDPNDPNELTVGNIFYNSGNVFITSSGNFYNTSTAYKGIKDLNMTIDYEREVYFVHYKYFIDIDQDKYTFSTNDTFKDSDAGSPFLTAVYLYNDKNELIAKANLSKPVSTQNDIFLILDDLETV